jgi:hypothetical protein
MTKARILTIICALFPTYCALFIKEGMVSALVLSIASIVGIIVTCSLENEGADIKSKVQMGWILHAIGIMVVIAVKNIF